MSNRPSEDFWTEGWPDEPGREDLAAFARHLARDLPALSDEATQRVRRRLLQETSAQPPALPPHPATRHDRQSPPGGPWAWWAGLAGAAAAAVLVAAGVMVWRDGASHGREPVGPAVVATAGAARAFQDSYEVGLPPGPSAAPAEPLVSLHRHRGLFLEPEVASADDGGEANP